MSGLSNGENVFYDLINLTADEWNQAIATELDYSVEHLKEVITARGLSIAGKRTRIEVNRQMINILAKTQQDDDKINVMEYRESPDDDILYRATLLDKFTVNISGDEEVNSIALTGKIMVGFDFSNVDLSHSYFCHCIFYNCVFNNCSLENMVISNCTFTRCSFVGADFTSSTIGRSRFFESTLDKVAFDYTSISDCSFVVSDFNDASFIQSKVLYTGFSDSEGSNSDWKDTDIIQCSFSNSNLSKCDFKRATMVDDIFIRVDLSDSDFSSVMVTCLTVAMTTVPEQFQEFFEVNHLLYSPAVFEWEPVSEGVTEDEYIEDDEEDDEDQPWK